MMRDAKPKLMHSRTQAMAERRGRITRAKRPSELRLTPVSSTGRARLTERERWMRKGEAESLVVADGREEARADEKKSS